MLMRNMDKQIACSKRHSERSSLIRNLLESACRLIRLHITYVIITSAMFLTLIDRGRIKTPPNFSLILSWKRKCRDNSPNCQFRGYICELGMRIGPPADFYWTSRICTEPLLSRKLSFPLCLYNSLWHRSVKFNFSTFFWHFFFFAANCIKITARWEKNRWKIHNWISGP